MTFGHDLLLIVDLTIGLQYLTTTQKPLSAGAAWPSVMLSRTRPLSSATTERLSSMRALHSQTTASWGEGSAEKAPGIISRLSFQPTGDAAIIRQPAKQLIPAPHQIFTPITTAALRSIDFSPP